MGSCPGSGRNFDGRFYVVHIAVHVCTRIKPAVPVENCSDAGTIIT